MTRNLRWVVRGWAVFGLLATMAASYAATGFDAFHLAGAVPADAMIAFHTRDHEGLSFVNTQKERVWAEVARQRFDKDLRRLLQNLVKESGGDLDAFDTRWQQIMDLAAGVEWSKLGQREAAFAMKLVPTTGAEWVILLMPPADQVASDFDGLAAILKNLLELDTEKLFVHSQEGEGDTVIHKVAVANQIPPLSLTLARHKDVLLLGFGSAMPEQALALLRGEADKSTGTLVATSRFREAFRRLPAPQDSFYFVDVSRLMAQVRGYARMAAAWGATEPTTAPATTRPAGPLAFLVPLVDQLDIWDYVAGVEATDGMKTLSEEVTVLGDDAREKPLAKALYGGTPVRDPLKLVPKAATSVSIGTGLDFLALYRAIRDFVEKEIPEGGEALAQFDAVCKDLPIDIEQDLLGALAGGYVQFSAPLPTPYMPGTVIVLALRDEEKARKVLDWATEALNGLLTAQGTQGAGVEDATVEGVEGFKRIILPPQLMMISMLGQPMYGIKDGHLFITTGPKVLAAALRTAAGQEEDFTHNERFAKEGLPMPPGATGYSFEDLTTFGEQLGTFLSMAGLVQLMAPDLAKNPAASAALSMITKAGNVVRKLDFYRSSCAVVTMEGNVQHTRKVVHYQEPPKPKTTTAPAEETAATKPAGQTAP